MSTNNVDKCVDVIYTCLVRYKGGMKMTDNHKDNNVERAERIAKLIAIIQNGISDYDLGYIQGRFENKCRTSA